MSSADMDRRLSFLESEVAKAKREIAMRDIKPTKGAPASKVYSIVVIGGNVLNDGSTQGIKYVSTISTVPSLYNPNVDTSFIDGIGVGTLYANGVSQGKVLIVNDGRAGSGISVALFVSDRIGTLGATVSIPLGSDPTQSVTCYVPDFL